MLPPGLSLPDWLRRLETLSPKEIDLGLERVAEVLQRMVIERPARVILVGGTNGKGSSVEMLRALLAGSGVIGTYTSPHVLRYNERIAVDGRPAADETIVAAFERVEAARGDVLLTYFEFGTLAALAVFEAAGVDTAILEVGLGGRLDAVNAVDPDASLITNVSLDHCEWLGYDVESIGREKAGILRAGKPAVFADVDMPASVAAYAGQIGAHLRRAGRDYSWMPGDGGRWSWRGHDIELSGLAAPALRGPMQLQNAAGALALLEALGLEELLQREHVNRALGSLRLPGRMQVVEDEQRWLFDVAHNPGAAAALAASLRQHEAPAAVAVVGILDDKDVEGIVGPLSALVDRWIAVTAASPRAIEAAELARRIANATGKACLIARSPEDAIANARAMAGAGGSVLVTGSFFTVGPLLGRLSASD
jgi:dihydrofolate synthase / folylpolyglutamate synthase